MPVEVSVNVDIDGAQELLELASEALDQPFDTVFDAVQKIWLEEAIPRNFAQQRGPDGPWPKLRFSRQKVRFALYGRARAAEPILDATGMIRRSVRVLRRDGDSLVVGSTNFIARAHEQGYTTASRSRIPGKVVPARPWAYLSGESLRDTFDAFDRLVFAEFDR